MNGRVHQEVSAKQEASPIITRRGFLWGTGLAIFGATNIAVLLRWWLNRGRRLSVTVTGPFPEGEKVKLAARREGFVDMECVEVRRGDDDIEVKCKFLLKGDKLRSNRLALRVELIDDTGKTLAAKLIETADGRNNTPANSRERVSLKNSPILTFPVPNGRVGDLSKIAFHLEEV